MTKDDVLVEKGRTAMWAIIAIAAIVYIEGMATHMTSGQPLIIPTIRGILTVALMYFLYEGYVWAKWISVVLYTLGGSASFYYIYTFYVELPGAAGVVFGSLFAVFGASLLVISISLIRSKRINAFLAFQRRRRNV
jgi:hypothetical protein